MKHLLTTLSICAIFSAFSQDPSKKFSEKLNGIQTSKKELTKSASSDNSSVGQAGVLTTSVPLVTVTSRTMTFPLQLNYQAGITVDQSAGPVGLGWALPIGSIVRDYGAYEPDYTATSSEADMLTTNSGSPNGWIEVSNGNDVNPFNSEQYLGYDAVKTESMNMPMSDEYHVNVPGFISNTFWNGGAKGTNHIYDWKLTEFAQWKVNSSYKTFVVSQEFSRINELNNTICPTCLADKTKFDSPGSYAAAIGMLPYVINGKTSYPTPQSPGNSWIPGEATRKVEYEDFNSFSITDENGTVYVFGRPLRGQKYIYSDDPYWNTGTNNQPDAAKGNFWKIDFIAEWLLTEIRSVDYADLNGNGIADDGDAGDWIRFEYTKPTKMDYTVPYGSVADGELQLEVPTHRTWSSFSQTDQASSLMREVAYLTRIVTPVQTVDLTISKRMDVDHDFYSKPANKVTSTNYYYSDRYYQSMGGSDDFDIKFPVETMKYDSLKVYSKLINPTIYTSENVTQSTIVLKYAAQGSAQELAVSSYLIRDNNNTDKLIDKPGDGSAFAIDAYNNAAIKRGKTTLIGVDFLNDIKDPNDVSSYTFEYGYNPSYNEIHKREIARKYFFPSLRQATNFTNVEAESPQNYTELVLDANGLSSTAMGRTGLMPSEFQIDYSYKEVYYKFQSPGSSGVDDFVENGVLPSVPETFTEILHVLKPVQDVYGYFYSDSYTNCAAAWSLTKVTYPTGGTATFEYEPGTFDKSADNGAWSLKENNLPIITNYNALAKERSKKQDLYNQYAPAPGTGIFKTLTAAFEVSLPETVGVRLKKKTLDDRINPVVVTEYEYGSGHFTSLPAQYVANYLQGFNSFVMREQLRHDWEKNYYTSNLVSELAPIPFFNDYLLKMRHAAISNIALDDYHSTHFYESVTTKFADGAKHKTSYGSLPDPANPTVNLPIYLQFKIFCTRLPSSAWDGRYVLASNSLIKNNIVLTKTESYEAGAPSPYQAEAYTYKDQVVDTRKMEFDFGSSPVYNHDSHSDCVPVTLTSSPNSLILWNNTFELWLPISGSVGPNAYHIEGVPTSPLDPPYVPPYAWQSTGNPPGNQDPAFVYADDNCITAYCQITYPSGQNNYIKWGTYARTLTKTTTTYKGISSYKEYTYHPTKFYLQQEKASTQYLPESQITVYEYAHEAYALNTPKFANLNLLNLPTRITTYLNSVTASQALDAKVMTYDYAPSVPKLLDTYQYETASINATTGVFTLPVFNPNNAVWRKQQSGVTTYNRAAAPIAGWTNQMYTKAVTGNGLNTVKATFASIGRAFDATYTGFEDISRRKHLNQWTTGSYLEEDWFTNESQNLETPVVITYQYPTVQLSPCNNTNNFSIEYAPGQFTTAYQAVTTDNLTNINVGDEVTFSFTYNGSNVNFTTQVESIHPNAFTTNQIQPKPHIVCFTNVSSIPAINPWYGSGPPPWQNHFVNSKITKQLPTYALTTAYARTGRYSYKVPTIRTVGQAAKQTPVRPVKINTGPGGPFSEMMSCQASFWLKYDTDIVAQPAPALPAPIARSEDPAGDLLYQRGEVSTTVTTGVKIICKVWNSNRTQLTATYTYYAQAYNHAWKQYTVEIPVILGQQEQWIEFYVENSISQVGVSFLQYRSVYVDDIIICPSDAQYSYNVYDKFGNTTFNVNNDDVFTKTTYDRRGRLTSNGNAYRSVTNDVSYFDHPTWSGQNNQVIERKWVGNATPIETRYYLDGFGKTKQVITADATRNNRIVSETNVFDNRGRLVRSYKPFYLQSATMANKYATDYAIRTAQLYDSDYGYTEVTYDDVPEEKLISMKLPKTNAETAIASTQSDAVNTTALTHPYLTVNPTYAIGTLLVHELIDAEGAKVRTYIDNKGQVVMEEHELGFTHTQNANGSISLTTTVQPFARTWFVYDGFGRLVATYDPEGKKSEYSYNSLGQLVKTISPDKGSTEMRYDKYGQLRFVRDAVDLTGSSSYHQFSYTKYDKWGRPIESGVYTKPPSGSSYPSNTTFDDLTAINNQEFPYSSAQLAQLHVKYDYYGNRYQYSSTSLTKTTVYSDHTISNFYYTAGKTDVTDYLYNADGQASSVSYVYHGLAGTHTIKPVYNSMRIPIGKDYVNSANSAYNHQWRTTLDHFGRPLVNTSIHNGITTQTGQNYYDPLGNLLIKGIGTTGVSGDPHVDYHVVRMNIRDQLTSMMSKKFRAGLTYSANGNITNQYWSTEYFDPTNGSTSNINQYAYYYDKMNRLIGADYKQSSVTGNPFSYFSTTNGALPDDFLCGILELELNGTANPTSNQSKSLEPNKAAKSTSVIKPVAGTPTAQTLGGIIIDLPPVEEICEPNTGATVYGYLPEFITPTAASNATKYDAAYWYQKNGNIATLNRNNETGVKTVQNYTYGSGSSNRLTSVTWTVGGGTPFTHNYGYDANGNLLNDSRNNISSIAYTLFNDLPNRMTSTMGTHAYRYDAAQQRSVKEISATDREYFIDDIVLAQDGKVKSYQVPEGYATPNVNGSTVAHYYNVKDWLGTTRTVIDALGAVYNAVDYYPYGKKLPGRAVFVTGYEGYRYQFTGHELDGETGYQYHGARYYSEELGRYMSVDPLAMKFAGWSTYNFCIDNPIRYIDPDGKAPLDWYVNNKTGEYKWFDGNGKQEGYTGVGSYKVTYNNVKNELNIFFGKDNKFIKLIDMNQENGKYKTEEAATFAIIAAELGGEFVNNEDPTVQPLIIGAIIDNRMKLTKGDASPFSDDGSVQSINGFQAMGHKAYSDFKYGNGERFGKGISGFEKRNMHIGLSTVYTATLDAVSILNKYYSVEKGETKQFEQMLYYAHGTGHSVNGDFNIAIPTGTDGALQYVRGDNKYIDQLAE